MIYSVFLWNRHLFWSPFSLVTLSDYATVCLGLGVRQLYTLQCVSVKLLSLYLRWLPFYTFRLINSVSRWNCHFSITTGSLSIHLDWSTVCLVQLPSLYLYCYLSIHSNLSTVCLGVIVISLSPLAPLLSIQTDLQCVSVKSPPLWDTWFPW